MFGIIIFRYFMYLIYEYKNLQLESSYIEMKFGEYTKIYFSSSPMNAVWPSKNTNVSCLGLKERKNIEKVEVFIFYYRDGCHLKFL